MNTSDSVKTYIGKRTYTTPQQSSAAIVTVTVRNAAGTERSLAPEAGAERFDWMRLGSAPSNLAAALLTDLLGYRPHPRVVDEFTMHVVHTFYGDAWARTSGALIRDLHNIRVRIGGPVCLRCLDARELAVTGGDAEPRSEPCPCARRPVAV